MGDKVNILVFRPGFILRCETFNTILIVLKVFFYKRKWGAADGSHGITNYYVGGINMSIFLKAFLFVLLAEMGDKSQLLSVAFASKYKVKDVLIGITSAIVLLNALAVLFGSYLSSAIPINYIQIIAAVLFLIFGFWTIFSKDDKDDEVVSKEDKSDKAKGANKKSRKYEPIITVASTFFVGEFGDKTQLMAITMAAQYKSPMPVFLGAVLGMLIADGIGVVGGTLLFKHMPKNVIKWIAAVIFITSGILTLIKAI